MDKCHGHDILRSAARRFLNRSVQLSALDIQPDAAQHTADRPLFFESMVFFDEGFSNFRAGSYLLLRHYHCGGCRRWNTVCLV